MLKMVRRLRRLTQILKANIKLAADSHRRTQTFCSLDLSEQKMSSLRDPKYYLTEKMSGRPSAELKRKSLL
jgi:hypothetical protein